MASPLTMICQVAKEALQTDTLASDAPLMEAGHERPLARNFHVPPLLKADAITLRISRQSYSTALVKYL